MIGTVTIKRESGIEEVISNNLLEKVRVKFDGSGYVTLQNGSTGYISKNGVDQVKDLAKNVDIKVNGFVRFLRRELSGP